jgi:hypothetical protein
MVLTFEKAGKFSPFDQNITKLMKPRVNKTEIE